MKKKNIIAFVKSIGEDAVAGIHAHGKRTRRPLRVMLIRDSRIPSDTKRKDLDIVVACDFSKPDKIAECLLPYQEDLLAISCRSDSNMEWFAKVIPHVPYLRTPSTESIYWATDKLLMRRRFRMFDRKGTPAFTVVRDNTKKERARIAAKVGFPLIIKPTNLAQSMLVSLCYHEEEFERTLRKAFAKIRTLYAEKKYDREPTIIAEQFMDGDMYSIDAYVTARGKVYCCPIIRVLTGKSRGRDDFSNYLATTVHNLKKASVAGAEYAVETAVHALALRSTTVHVELMKVDDDWKIIEVGPRIGGYRQKLYQLAYGIDHSVNDVLVRIPEKPIIPKRQKAHATVLKYYPDKEGVIMELKGIKKVRELKSFRSISMYKKVGEKSVFATHGGTAVLSVALANPDRSKLLADVRRVEKLLKVMVV
ncbi:ATP-grasp domain-containing protein [Candidatus Kaiserbacteria bacterium]|nr:ATP-grasp domain-containing protein [Candidatus Kaiserbacteria bacterium]